MVDTGNYPTGTTVGTQTSGMSPEMEAKFLWYLDQVVANMNEPHAGQGPIEAQQVVGFTDAQNQAMESAMDPEGWKKYLNQYQDYSSEGIASWYGMKFHGRKTSNGEIFDIRLATAAHKSLPIPCYVSVTNLENNRSIIVRVNDRGPFHPNRIIDLSYAAAIKLGFAEKH